MHESLDYNSIKTKIAHLNEDEISILFAIVVDESSRSLRTASLMNQAGCLFQGETKITPKVIDSIVHNLVDANLIALGKHHYEVEDELRLPLILACAAKLPQETVVNISNALISLARLYPNEDMSRPDSRYHYRGREAAFDYTNFVLKTRLLLLSNKYEKFIEELNKLEAHNDWRQPERRVETIREVRKVFEYFDEELFSKIDRRFGILGLENFIQTDYNWTTETSQKIKRFLTSNLPKLDVHQLKVAGFAAFLSLDSFLLDQDSWAVFPEAGFMASLARGDKHLSTRLIESLQLSSRSEGITGLLYQLFQIQASEQYKSQFFSANDHTEYKDLSLIFSLLQVLRDHRNGLEVKAKNGLKLILNDGEPHPIVWLVGLWVCAWTGMKPPTTGLGQLFVNLSDSEGPYRALIHQPYLYGELLNALVTVIPGHVEKDKWLLKAEKIKNSLQVDYLIGLESIPEAWEHTMRVLDDLVLTANKEAVDSKPSRLIWIVNFEKQEIVVREQLYGSRGWSKGKVVSPNKLIEMAAFTPLPSYDEIAISSFQRLDGRSVTLGGKYSNDSIKYDFGKLLYNLDGHPNLVIDDERRIPLEVKQCIPRLLAEELEGGTKLSFQPPGALKGYFVEKQTPTRYNVFELSPEQAKLSAAIGKSTILPPDQSEKVYAHIRSLREKVEVIAIKDLKEEELLVLEGNTVPCVHLVPFGTTYRLEIYGRPLDDTDLYVRIGEGQDKVFTTQYSAKLAERRQKVLINRNLEAEIQAVEKVLEQCPRLMALPHDGYEWVLDDDQSALEVLIEIREVQNNGDVTVEYPKGEKLRLVGYAGDSNLRIQVKKDREWFSVDGVLKIDENKVVKFSKLLEHIRIGGGRFIELEEGQYLAITQELRARLEAMESIVQQMDGEQYVSTLAAGAFAELAQELEFFESDVAWQQNLDRISASQDFVAEVPDNFGTDFRSYQLEGYQWLRRLAEWGVGGCLADDMGLGKTVQALGLLLSRGHLGPALVIAPASVTRNWKVEAEKFTPDLTPKLITSRVEAGLLKKVKANDIVLVSYGLLSFIEEEIQNIQFSTIVLDEAQAIKNPSTKRAQIIFQLKGDFKMATTGTPIENHLGELWSLFRFINNGLLGNRTIFNKQFANPIYKEDNKLKTMHLRRLVKPFMLRRKKEDVLKELPPKTEINLRVDLSEEETALYESMRRKAVHEIENSAPNAKRMVVLQQLTRLRQAACHPKLVKPDSELSSSKLQLAAETIKELLDTGHQALVFSQFVRHLKLVEEWAQNSGIKYCYLDGSTSGKKRQQQVEAFQNGEAGLFLISLKAGGTGLNLTAADYVIHLDPWWNPAAEDQASDRAHRIGQQRPVTVYRLVSANTIEERILALHAEKRDLADQILEGTDSSGKLSVGEVINLLKSESA